MVVEEKIMPAAKMVENLALTMKNMTKKLMEKLCFDDPASLVLFFIISPKKLS